MRRTVALTVLGLLVLAGLSSAAIDPQNVVVPYMLKAPAPITVDGTLDEWSFAFPLQFNQSVMRTWMRAVVDGWVVSDDENCSGALYMMYDADNFYFAANIVDDAPGHPSDAAWAADAIEFYFANWDVGKDKVVPAEEVVGWVDDAATGKYSFQLNIAFNLAQQQVIVSAYYGPASPVDAAETAYKLTDTGYILEGRIPLAALVSTATGNTFEFPAGKRIPAMWSLYDIDESENSADFKGYAYTKAGFPGWQGISPGWQVCDILTEARDGLWSAEQQFDFVAPYIKKAGYPSVTIDGVLDDWNFCFPVDFNQDVMEPGMRAVVDGWVQTDDENCSGTLYQMYDDDNFYFAANVIDDAPGHFSDAAWAADAIEYYMANWDIGDEIVPATEVVGWVDDAGTAGYSFQLNISFDASQDTVVTSAYYGPASPIEIAETQYALTDNGYILEGRIPISALISTATGNTWDFQMGARYPFMWSLYDIDESESSADFKGYAYTKAGFPGWQGVSPGWQYADVKDVDFIDYGDYLVGVHESKPALPSTLSLANAPNPFNPSTDLHFTLAKSGATDLRIFNLQGQMVKAVFTGASMSMGSHRVTLDMSDLPSGCYVAVLAQGAEKATHKMLLMK